VEVEGFKTNIQLEYCVSYSKKYEFSVLRRRNKVFIRSEKDFHYKSQFFVTYMLGAEITEE
jgi:hypothetical protein